MTTTPHTRAQLARYFADALDRYQQDHRALMDALRDESVSVAEFEKRSLQLSRDVNALKGLRTQLKQLHTEGGPAEIRLRRTHEYSTPDVGV